MSEETQETQEVVETTDDGLSLEDALKELSKVRKEAAARRVKSREIEEKASKWEDYVASQKTELEKLADEKVSLLSDNEKLKKELVREKVGRTLKDPEDFEFLVGDTEEELKAKAEKLNSRAGKRTNTFAGERGSPVGQTQAPSTQDWFASMWDKANTTR